jgi:hypothetical protein
METNKAIEIYLPNNTDSLNKDLLEKQNAISKILKGTPFEKDTYVIFEHLVRVQGALHKTESDMSSRKEHLKEELDVIKTLLALYTIPEKIEIRCGVNGVIGLDANIPQSIVGSITLKIKNAAIALFNQSPYLFCGKDGNILSPTNKKHLKAKEKDLEAQIEELNTKREKSGKATYTKDTPNKVTDTFRMLCAIKGFCKCDGFYGWGERGNATRNECIFKCLQVFGYANDEKYLDANTQRSRVRDAEKRIIVFVCPPL